MNRISVPADQSRATLSKNAAELLQRLRGREFRQTRGPSPLGCEQRGGATLWAPASAAQQRLWFIDQLEGVSRGAYHIPLAWSLHGSLDLEALRRALDTLVQRHEVLRTVFINREGEAQQQIATEVCFALQVIDLSAGEEAERTQQLARHKTEEAEGYFDLKAGPLVRGRLLRLQADEHVLLITMHHIISDGWSIGIVIREITELYTAYHEGRSHRLAPLPMQYADYARRQRQGLQPGVLDEQLRFWRAHLDGAAPQLELPTDKLRPATPSFRAHSLDFTLDAALCADLETLARRRGMTRFMVLYAAWAVLLARLSGQQDIVIGTPLANRRRPELEGLIGLFANTLALRIQVCSDSRVSDLLSKVKEVTLNAYDHQDTPFDHVVEALQPDRRIGRNPLFQVMLALQDTPGGALRWPQVTVTEDSAANGYSMFDLLLLFEERGQQMAARVEYAADLFEPATIEHWMACFTVLLRQMQDPADPLIGNLPLLSPEQRQQIVERFNATEAAYPRDKLIHQLFEEQAQRTPHAVAVECEGESLTYAQLNARANQLAHCLRERGVGPGCRVGICLERSLELLMGLIGVLKAGGAYVPLDPAYPAQRLTYMLDDSAPVLVLSHGAARAALQTAVEGLPRAVPVMDLDADTDLWMQQSSANLDGPTLGLSSRELAYIIYTSGSTGRPKGIAVSHAPVINLISWVNQTFDVGPRDTLLFVTSVCFDLSVYDIFGVLAAGGRIRLATEALINDPERLARILLHEGITFWDSAPAALQLLVPHLQGTSMRGTSLRLVFNSGDWIPLSLPAAMARAFPNARFVSLGGATEATVWSNWYEVQKVRSEWKSIPYGRPIQNARYYILDTGLEPVPRGVAGDLYIGGECLANGYTDEGLTRERFLESPFVAGDRLYKTGDRARHGPDGNIEFLGRSDFQVKIRGFRIELGEIESRLLEHSGVAEAVVLAREDATYTSHGGGREAEPWADGERAVRAQQDGPGDKRLVCYYTTVSGADVTAEALKAYLSSTLAGYMVPAAYVSMPSLPVTKNGKLDRQRLPPPDWQAYGARDYEAPRGPVEIALASLWHEVLQLDRVGRHDNFFQLGGHSLLGMKLIAKVAATFAVELPAIAIFRHPTIQQMAVVIGSLRSSVPEAQITTRQRIGPAPLTFSQLFRWNSLLPQERPFRQLARATRLRGLLDIPLLERSVAQIIRRHEALQSRFVILADEDPVQDAVAMVLYELPVDDLTGLPTERREEEVGKRMEQLILEPIDLGAGPLFGARLLRLQDDEHVLLVALHLMIADGFSMNVLMRDVLTVYTQLKNGVALSLPEVAVQLADYAQWQHDTRKYWSGKSRDYWNRRLAGAGRCGFPQQASDPTIRSGGATVPVEIGKELTAGLREWCRSKQTTLVMGVFTAYATLVLRACSATDAVIRYQTNGRLDPQVQNTIGVFAAVLNLRIQLLEADSPADVLQRVTEEYCSAVEHADLSWLDAQRPRPEFTYNSTFNWVPLEARHELSGLQDARQALTAGSVSFANPLATKFDIDDEPSVLLTESADGIVGDIYFSPRRYSKQAMERLAQNLARVIQSMVTEPARRARDITLL